MSTITVKNDTFEIVESVPSGYQIWNIGKNMIDGYLPLVEIDHSYDDGCHIKTDTPKAIKIDGLRPF